MQVSVIIPVFNEEKYISSCLTNLLNQEVKAEEIIVVDNLSTDHSSEIIKKFPVKLVEAQTRGIAQARDHGFNLAKSEIIARCDADSLVPKDWIKRIIQNFDQENISGLIGPIIYNDLPLPSPFYSKIFIHFMRLIQNHHTLIGNNLAISKSIWQKVKTSVCSDKIIYHEDIDLAIHIAKAGGKIKYDPFFLGYTSGRRIVQNPISFFIEYPYRLSKTLSGHQPL